MKEETNNKEHKKEENTPEELVLTPGGRRPKSKVHQVPPGHHIDGSGGRLKIVHTASGEIIADLGEMSPEEPAPGKKSKPGSRKSTRKAHQAKPDKPDH